MAEEEHRAMAEGEPEAEEWMEMESKLVMYSIIAGIIALIVLAYLVNTFILS